jgi:hypothetical protein
MKALLMFAVLSISSALASTPALAAEMTSVKDATHALTGVSRGKGCTPEGDYIQWQCGARPSGAGWVRVSPTCYHRSIGHC